MFYSYKHVSKTITTKRGNYKKPLQIEINVPILFLLHGICKRWT